MMPWSSPQTSSRFTPVRCGRYHMQLSAVLGMRAAAQMHLEVAGRQAE